MKSQIFAAMLLLTSGSLALADATMTIQWAGTYQCATPQETSGARWIIELDERVPLAVVNDEDRPAEYSPLHIRIRLAPEGPMLTIGRISGRVLESTPSGETLAMGHCQRAIKT